MKYFKLILFSILCCSGALHAQIDSVIVETYYISDANDFSDSTASDSGGARNLSPGSVTYRIYIDLADSCSLKKVYGDAKHVWKIESDSVFFNHYEEGVTFANDLNKARFLEFPTVALDTWLSLGHGTKNKNIGVLKAEDTDGTLLGGANSNGLLTNDDGAAGIPLTVADGFLTTTVSASWSSYGIEDFISGKDSTIFGSIIPGNIFVTDSIDTAFIQTNGPGAMGPTEANRVLIAQLTTKGKISFELNLIIEQPDGNGGTKLVKYVAKNNEGDEILSPFLTYPPACGCTDKKYLEYNPLFSCPVSDSCKTLKVFGCTDPMACNYDANANSMLTGFCCYPGHCQDRDLSQACPSLSERYTIFPNPVAHTMAIEIYSPGNHETRYEVYDMFGRTVMQKKTGIIWGTSTEYADVSALPTGIYLLRIFVGDTYYNRSFIKN